MKVAVTYENGEVFQHFGHTAQFAVYEVDAQSILSEKILDTNGSGHGALAELLHNEGIEVLICGGIGAGAKNALGGYGISIYGGITGSCKQAVELLVQGTLPKNENVACSHHEHHDAGHTCKEDHQGCQGNGSCH